jgi:hypothetical protein
LGLDNLLEVCPAVLLNKFVAVTSCDSGPLPIDAHAQAIGWRIRDGIAYSPQVTSPELFPYHVHFDEWYVFSAAAEPERISNTNNAPRRVETFVNAYLRLDDPEMNERTTQLWQLIEHIRPESYIAEADWGWLTLITRNPEIFASLQTSLGNRRLSQAL